MIDDALITRARTTWPWIVTAVIIIAITSLRFWSLESRSLTALNTLKPIAAVLQPVAILGCWRLLSRDRTRAWRGHWWLVAAVLVAYASATFVLYPFFDDPALRHSGLDSDIDDEFIVAAGNARRLRNPYAEPLYSGNPISEGPAWVILNAVFGSPRTFFLLAPVHAALFSWCIWRRTRLPAAVLLALLLALASPGVWESSFGGDLAAAGFAMSAALLCACGVSHPPTRREIVLGALLAGAASTVRLPYVVFPCLAALLLWRSRARFASLTMLSIGLTVGLGSHLAFWSIQEGAYPPLHLIAQSGDRLSPFALAGLLTSAAIIGMKIWFSTLREEAAILGWQGIALFVPFAVIAATSIAQDGITGEDWTRYLVPSIPAVAAAAALSSCRPGSSALRADARDDTRCPMAE